MLTTIRVDCYCYCHCHRHQQLSAMIRNYIHLALRHLLKNRTYAAINILGLAVGIAACLLIFRLVQYELSFDKNQPDYSRICRVVTKERNQAGEENFTSGIPIPAMDVMQNSVTQLEQFARTHSVWPTITVPDAPGSLSGRKFATDGNHEVAIFTEPSFFKIIRWNWVSGDPEPGLKEPNAQALTQKMAEKCFGSWQAAVGQTVVMDNSILFTVRGILADPPYNSDFQFNLVASYATMLKNPDLYGYHPDWGNISSNDQAYALLRDPGQLAAANTVLAGVGQEEYAKNGGSSNQHSLQPLAELHFDDRFGSNFGTHVASKNSLGVLSLIGLLVLAMACFNFINLATAQAASRSREVGVRKSLGGSRGQLLGQFMGETTVIVLFAVVLGTGLAALLAPLLKHVSDVPHAEPFLTQPSVLAFLLATTLVVSVLSGFYPSLVLSGFNPVNALKNNITARTVGGVSLRKVLVVMQFVIAQALIIGTLVTLSQMNYLRTMDMGFRSDLVYVINGISSDSASAARFEGFKNQLQQIPAVEAVSLASDMPSSNNNWDSNFAFGRGAEDAPFSVFMKFVDADYFKTYGLRLIAGRALEPSDTIREVVVNRTLLRKLGIADPQSVLGQEFKLGSRRRMPVVGVVEDFQLNSARDEMKPVAIFSRKSFYSTAGIKIRPENISGTTAQIRRLFETTFPEQVFDGGFFDEKIAAYYRDEERLSALCKGFALLAILISCLGLYGLASLLVVQKTKEVGVRKVLGASVASVVGLLSKDFLLLVLLATVASVPLAWWAMSRWLQDFVYRTPLSAWFFIATVLISGVVALLTVGTQTWKAARANPVKSLRSE